MGYFCIGKGDAHAALAVKTDIMHALDVRFLTRRASAVRGRGGNGEGEAQIETNLCSCHRGEGWGGVDGR